MLKLTTLEYPLDSKGIDNLTFDDEASLLDSDIIIIDPAPLKKYWREAKKYDDGLYRLYSSLGSDSLFHMFAWRRKELETLLSNGKVIIVFLSPVNGVLAEKRNKADYERLDNYQWLPGNQKLFVKLVVRGEGEEIELTKQNHPYSQFFNAFKDELRYCAYFDIDADEPDTFFLINKAKRPVGCFLQVEEGYLVYLPKPSPNVDPQKLVGVLTQCSKPLIYKEFKTPEPDWLKDYEVPGESEILVDIKKRIVTIEKQNKELDGLESKRQKLNEFRGLLYESGKILENIVLRSLRLMGFEANRFQEGDFEHDVVLEAEEGRAIAEIEGKDNDSIHIDKLDQLSRVVDEDFNLNGKYREGILIGNHYRFTAPDKRKEPFTEKVLLSAERKKFGLLTTSEILKAVVKILENPTDEEFKKSCRKAILEGKGQEITLEFQKRP